MKRKHIFLLWGSMDVLHVLNFFYWNLSRGRIPFYDDMVASSRLASEFGAVMPEVMFWGSSLLTISVIFTAYMFITQARSAVPAAWAQFPLRLILVVPSLSGFPFLVNYFELTPPLVWMALLSAEAIKMLSLRWAANAH